MAKLDLFGNHKREIWKQLAEQLNADFFRGKGFKPDWVEAYHGNWAITLDLFVVDKMTFTRIRAPYINRDDFTFKIVREHVGHRVGKALGLQQDVEVGQERFDRDFIVKGSDERKLQMMFENPHIRELLSFEKNMQFMLRKEAPLFQKPRFPDDVNEVYYHAGTIIKDLERLHDLFELFAHTLDHLCAIGTAYKDDPDFLYYK
ncbi:MAG: DUF3137 domain-containing protein [Bacteroidia bacterium]